MNKFLLLFLTGVLTACGVSNNQEHARELEHWVADDGKVRVLATTAIVQDLVERVGGDRIKVIAIINGNLDPHSYEVVKGDDEKFAYADVVFANGLMLEHSGSMQYQLKHHKSVLFLGDELLKKYPQEIIYINAQLDPHIWMDISLWSKGIALVANKLSEEDPAHQEEYRERALEVQEEFLHMDAKIKGQMSLVADAKRYLVTSHDAFNYYVRRYFVFSEEGSQDAWRKRVKALQGLAPDEQISVLQVKEIVDYVCHHNIGVIFPENNLSKDSLEKVKEACHKRGRDIKLAPHTLYGDTLGGKTYLEVLAYNTEVLEGNLRESHSSH